MKACPICKVTGGRLDRVLNGFRLIKCCNCNFVFADLSKEIVENANARHDEQFIDSFEASCQSPFEKAFFRDIAERHHKQSGPGRVLDVGCGTGLLLSFFKELGWECVGVDLSSWTARYAQRCGFTFHQGRLEDLALPEKSFDLVVSTSTLEHIEDPLPHIQEIIRVVKPGGKAYFSGIPNYGSADILLGLSSFNNNMPPDHPNYFTTRTLRGLFTAAGIEVSGLVVKSYGLPGAHQFYFALKKILKKRASKQLSSSNPEAGFDSVDNCRADRQLIRSIGASLYVLLGRPFGVGSKLDVEMKL